jgi:DNA-directed RNA polymerase II subunit RPB1
VVWKDLGPTACCDIISNVQLIVNNWLVNTGFTVGVQDIVAKQEIIDNVKKKIAEYKKEVKKVISKTHKGELERQPGRSTMESFEHIVNSVLNNARNEAGNIALETLDSHNRLKGMVFAGSKGSNMNIS